jgi:hypothetical protein
MQEVGTPYARIFFRLEKMGALHSRELDKLIYYSTVKGGCHAVLLDDSVGKGFG